jgi:hypothetical protein
MHHREGEKRDDAQFGLKHVVDGAINTEFAARCNCHDLDAA